MRALNSRRPGPQVMLCCQIRNALRADSVNTVPVDCSAIENQTRSARRDLGGDFSQVRLELVLFRSE